MIHKPKAKAKVIPRLVKACRFLRVLVLVGLVLPGPAFPVSPSSSRDGQAGPPSPSSLISSTSARAIRS